MRMRKETKKDNEDTMAEKNNFFLIGIVAEY